MNSLLKFAPALTSIALLAATMTAHADRGHGYSVVTETNEVANAIVFYSADSKGQLKQTGSVPTGGAGSAAGLGSQSAVAYDEESELLAAVNAGDNTISLFRNAKLVANIPSGGVHPISVAIRRGVLYALNGGDATHAANISGFYLAYGKAWPITGGTAALSTAQPGPAQVSFSPNGESLVVTEKGTNMIDTFDLAWWAGVRSSTFDKAAGTTPFGFAFDARGRIFVSEAFGGAAGASALSSYARTPNGLKTLSASIPTNQTAACWAVVSPNNKFVFTTDAASGVVSTFAIAKDGTVKLAGNSAPIAGSTLIDASISEDGKFLYVLGAGAHKVFTYAVANDGSLTKISDADMPLRAAGLAIVD